MMKQSAPLVTTAVLLSALLASAIPTRGADRPAATPEEGLALAIVFDTSGSMAQSVPDSAGKMTPKYRIASRALSAIVDRLQAHAAAKPGDVPRKLNVGLFVFERNKIQEAVKFEAFNPEAIRTWLKNFSNPTVGTPLGEAVRTASQAVLNSNLKHKHVLVLTDGINTVGPDPAAVIPKLKQQADQKQASLGLHFVAFDVDANLFDGVKKLGVTVVGATDGKQLNEQLEFILQRKILLEDEEPPAAKKK